MREIICEIGYIIRHSFPLCALCFLLLNSGCITRLNTPSGGPEITIHGLSPEKVKERFYNDLADNGFHITRNEGITVVATKEGDVADNIWFGTTWKPFVQKCIRMNFIVAADGGVRVLYHGFIKGGLGETEVRGDWWKVQWNLERLAADLEGRAAPPAPTAPKSPRISAR